MRLRQHGEVTDTITPADVTTTAPVEETEKALNIVTDSKAIYEVIRDEDADTASVTVAQARNVLKRCRAHGASVSLNPTLVVMRMEFGGETVYMSTGDATCNGMEICTKMYGDYLQSDLIQVCHHGYGTWGNDSAIIKAYEAINAPTVLWPQGLEHYETHKTLAYNSVLFRIPNYKEVYVSGPEGDTVSIPIPYTVGSGIVNSTGVGSLSVAQPLLWQHLF